MSKQQPLFYLPTMFATCMTFQVIYVACVALWYVVPSLAGHAVLVDLFPQFKLLDPPSFIFGLIMSGVYGWFVSVTFVFVYNLWPQFIGLISGTSMKS